MLEAAPSHGQMTPEQLEIARLERKVAKLANAIEWPSGNRARP
jgi:hypothetical protein